MPLSSANLSAIQKAGAAVYAADEQLKNATRNYMERVKASLESSPLSANNDAMLENLKTVARLSQTITGIEQEIAKVFHAASELKTLGQTMQGPRPAQQTRRAKKRAERPQASGSVKSPRPAGRSLSKPQPAPSSKPVKVGKRAPQAGDRPAVSGNAAKLLNYLERVLNAQDFGTLNQTIAAKEIDIPLGSMTAALKKLMESGRLLAGPTGGYKLI